jgi:hypothetical protein
MINLTIGLFILDLNEGWLWDTVRFKKDAVLNWLEENSQEEQK